MHDDRSGTGQGPGAEDMSAFGQTASSAETSAKVIFGSWRRGDKHPVTSV